MRAAIVALTPARARGTSILRSRLVRDVVGTLGMNAGTVLLNFLTTLILARILGAGDFGAYAFALAWATLLTIPAILGLTPLIVRYVATYVAGGRWSMLRGLLRRSNQIVGATSCAVGLAGAGIAVLAKGSDPAVLQPLLVGLLLVPLLALTSLRQAAMQGLGRVVLGRAPEALLAPSLFLCALGVTHLARNSVSPTLAMAVNVAAAAVAFLVGARLLGRSLPAEIGRERPTYETRAWVRAGLPLLAFSGLTALNGQIGTLLLGWLGPPSQVGVYNVTARTTTFISFLWLATAYALMPRVAALYAQGRLDRVQRLLTQCGRVILVVSILVAVALTTSGRAFLSIFGGDFRAGITPLRILALGELSNAIAGYAGLALVASGNESALTLGTAAGAGVNLVLTAILVPVLGASGAAVGMATGMAVANAAFTYLLRRRTGLNALSLGRQALPARAA